MMPPHPKFNQIRQDTSLDNVSRNDHDTLLGGVKSNPPKMTNATIILVDMNNRNS
jgi:hypothetical protein